MDVREEAVQKKLELGGFLTTGTKYPLRMRMIYLLHIRLVLLNHAYALKKKKSCPLI